MILVSFVYKRILMKSFFFGVLILSATFTSKAQQTHFIYLQTDNKQSFYVKLNNKLFSSASSGYLVIPKLQNGDYNFTIGFPKNEWPQQTFFLKIDNKDLGGMLKNFGDKGWGLFNIQTLNVTMSTAAGANTTNTIVHDKTDAFSNVLADVVNTPALKQNKVEIVAAEAKPLSNTIEAPVSQKKETIVADTKPAVEKAAIVIPVKEINKVNIINTTLDSSGRSAIYIDKADNSNDTIRVFIPYDKGGSVIKKDIIAEKNEEVKPDSTFLNSGLPNSNVANAIPSNPINANEPAKKKEEVNPDTKFLNIELPNPNIVRDTVKVQETLVTQPVKVVPSIDTIKIAPEKVVIETNIKPLSINSDCRKLATDIDFMKLRKKMAAENNDDDMIAVARKTFKSNCFSTDQIKNLSVLFLKDNGRYQFFDTAYPFVYDSQNFKTLETQLTDEYLINRFKAMIRH